MDAGDVSEDDLAAFVHLPTQLFAAFDRSGQIVWANPALGAALGYDDGELSGATIGRLVHPDDLGAAESLLDVACRPAAAVETRWRRRDGTWRWLEWTAHASEDSGHVYAFGVDVTTPHLARGALVADAARMQAVVDQSPVATFVTDADGRYVVVNEAFCETVRLGNPDVLGRTCGEVWPGAGDLSGDDVRLLRSGEALARDEVIERDNGPCTTMTVQSLMRDTDGQIVGTVGLAMDITERANTEQELNAQARLLTTIVDTSPDIVTIVDGTGRVREVSKAASRMLGYELDDPVQEEIENLVHEDDVPMTSAQYGRLLTLDAKGLEIRHRVRHRDGHWVTLDSRGRAIMGDDGHPVGALVMSRDISDDLTFEKELRAAVEVAEGASTAKSEFLSRMSHELRTPLNAMLGFAQLLAMDDLPEQTEQAVGHIVRAGRHLLDLINEVLDIARIESGHVEMSVEPVVVSDVLDEAIALARPLAQDRGVQITGADQPSLRGVCVLADRQRLLQVLLNLLSNAVKYNDRHGLVDVSLTCTPGGRAEISVADTGVGIRPEDIERVFEPFDRLGAQQSGIEGTGVGLTLSKHLVERMGGRITVRSERGVGSTFTVVLPLGDLPRKAPSRLRELDGLPFLRWPLRILHVEDNPANLELVDTILRRHGDAELVTTMCGEEGLRMAKELEPDVILLDLHLPDMSGLDVLARLDADPATRDVPVIVVSADVTPTRVAQMQGTGIAAFLTKPIDVAELVRAIDLATRGGDGDR